MSTNATTPNQHYFTAQQIEPTDKIRSAASMLKLNKIFRRKNPNTIRLRGKIQAAIRTRRFFLYLVTVHPCLALSIFLPWLAFSPALKEALSGTWFGWLNFSMRVTICFLSSLLALFLIRSDKRRFRRLIRRRARKER